MADTANCKPLKSTVSMLRIIWAQHLRPLLSYVNVYVLHLHFLRTKFFPSRTREWLAAPEETITAHGNKEGLRESTNKQKNLYKHHHPSTPPKKLHYNFHTTKKLHCSIYWSRCKQRTKTKKKPPHKNQPTKTNPNSGWGGRSVCISTFFLYTSVSGQQFNATFLHNILIHLIQLPTPSQWAYILLCDCNCIPTSLAWRESKQFPPLLPTRTHGYISTFVGTRDLVDRI